MDNGAAGSCLLRFGAAASASFAFAAAAAVPVGAQIIDAAEVVRSYGAIDGPPGRIFDRIGSIAFLDGSSRLLVADGGSSQIRIYGEAPDPVLVFGRTGQGPGEFASLDWALPYRADSVVAWDGRLGRLTVMTPAGEHGRTITVSRGTGVSMGSPGRGGSSAFLDVVGPLANGRFVARRGILSVGPGDTTAVRRELFWYVQLGPDGGVLREVVSLPDDEQFVWSDGDSRSVRSRAFGRTTSVDVRGTTMTWAINDAFRATTLDLVSGANTVLGTGLEPIPVADSDRRRWRAQNRPKGDLPADFIRGQTALIEAMSFPAHMPWHGRVVLARNGDVWLEHHGSAGTPSVWTVFSSGGSTRTVRFPAGFTLMDVSGDLAAGIAVGELDVQRVTVIRVSRG
jgi:hypothetical protein